MTVYVSWVHAVFCCKVQDIGPRVMLRASFGAKDTDVAFAFTSLFVFTPGGTTAVGGATWLGFGRVELYPTFGLDRYEPS